MAKEREERQIAIGERIAGLRDAKAWSQEDLAHKVGVSSTTISRWERGLHAGFDANIRKLADALGVEPESIKGVYDGTTQLDRIESKLDAVITMLGGHGAAAQPPAAVPPGPPVGPRPRPRAESPTEPARKRAATRPASRRKRAS